MDICWTDANLVSFTDRGGWHLRLITSIVSWLDWEVSQSRKENAKTSRQFFKAKPESSWSSFLLINVQFSCQTRSTKQYWKCVHWLYDCNTTWRQILWQLMYLQQLLVKQISCQHYFKAAYYSASLLTILKENIAVELYNSYFSHHLRTKMKTNVKSQPFMMPHNSNGSELLLASNQGGHFIFKIVYHYTAMGRRRNYN